MKSSRVSRRKSSAMGMLPKLSKRRKTTMDLYYRAIEQAAETWQVVKQLPNYEEVVGELLFRQIFEICPDALTLYSFGSKETAVQDKVPTSVYESPLFLAHAGGVVAMLEKVIVMMLGDDLDTLADSIQALGSRHVDYGVHPAHYRIVETALLRTLEGALGDQWTVEVRKGWAAVFKFISKAMMSGAGAELQIIKDRRCKLEHAKSATLRLKVIDSSQGISHLSRSGVGSRTCRRARSDGDVRYLDRNSSPTQLKRQSSDPPRKPTRRSTEGTIQDNCIIDTRWSDLSSFREEDDLTSEDDSRKLQRSHSFSSEDSSDTRPPNIIVIHCSPSQASTNADSRSTTDQPRSSSSSDVAPRMPRRRSEDDILVLKLVKGDLDGTDQTVESSDSHDDDDPGRFDEYWREEKVKIIYEV